MTTTTPSWEEVVVLRGEYEAARRAFSADPSEKNLYARSRAADAWDAARTAHRVALDAAAKAAPPVVVPTALTVTLTPEEAEETLTALATYRNAALEANAPRTLAAIDRAIDAIRAELPPPAETELHDCDDCSGRGFRIVPAWQAERDGEGEVECETCGGTGQVA